MSIRISLVVAASANGAIGKANSLPWHLPADLKYFKNLTWGMPVVMGRKTYTSIGKPLPGRPNLVMTRQLGWSRPGVKTIPDFYALTEWATENGYNEVFVIGGAEIFDAALPIASRIYLTRVEAEIEGDTFFHLPEAGWDLRSETFRAADEKNVHDLRFQVWERSAP